MRHPLQWERKIPNSANNFDLILINYQDLNHGRMKSLLESITNETHRGLTLSSQAGKEFERWFENPSTSLKSTAYVLLSNWFLTQSGDRNSMVASRCEALWDDLFPCRPPERLSSSEAGRNHVMIPSTFANFWDRLMKAQEGTTSDKRGSSEVGGSPPSERTRTMNSNGASISPLDDHLQVKFDSNGLHFVVDGSPNALAKFLKVYERITTEQETK